MVSLSIIVVAIAIILGLLAQQQQRIKTTPPTFSTVACTSDEVFALNFSVESKLDQLPTTTALDPCHVYSDSYIEARQTFRQAAKQAGAKLHTLSVPVSPDKALNKLSGGDYTIDIAVLQGTGPGLMVHTSGVHGVEAYAGSPIQIAFLESVYPQLLLLQQQDKDNNSNSNSKSKELPTIVLVHAINPYGMAHYRRTNDNNVDLNRNGLHPEDWKHAITSLEATTETSYESYARLSPYFNPPGPPTRLFLFLTLWTTMATALVHHGFDHLKAGLVAGQYFEPRGVFYGGQELQPSLHLLRDFLANTLLVMVADEDKHDASTSASRQCCTGTVTWIDVHTGLGVSGDDTILTSSEATSLVARQAPIWFPGGKVPAASKDAKDAAKGYDHAKGFTTTFFRRLFEETPTSNDPTSSSQSSSSYLAIAQEFGTIPLVLVAHALIVENQAFQHLPSSESVEWAKQTTRRAFYKETPEWRKQILERGLTLMLQAIQRSSATSA